MESVTIYFDSFLFRSHLTEICREVVKNSKFRGEGSWICCVFSERFVPCANQSFCLIFVPQVHFREI